MPPADTRRVVRRRLAPCGAPRRRTLCLHVLSSFQRTGYQWCALAFRLVRRHVPHQLYFLEGNLAILQSVHFPVNSFLAPARRFCSRRFREGRTRCRQRFTVSGGPRAQGATGRCELKEVSAGKCRRRVTLGPTNIRRAPETVNTGNRPNWQLIRTRVTDWLVEL
jgi:hypothetical protein